MILGVFCAIAAAEPEPGSRKDVAYINVEPSRWTLGTAAVQRVVALEDGKLLLKSLKDKTTGRELASRGASEEFFVRLNDGKEPLTGATGPWRLVRARQTRLKQGELQLDLSLARFAASHQELRGVPGVERHPAMGHFHQRRRSTAKDRRAGVLVRDRPAG